MGLRTIRKLEIHHGIVTNSERVDTYGPTASYGPRHSCRATAAFPRGQTRSLSPPYLMENSRADETTRNFAREDSHA